MVGQAILRRFPVNESRQTKPVGAPLTLVFMLRRTLPLFLVLSPLVARAQTLSPVLIQSGAQIQVPAPLTSDRVRLQVLLAGSTLVLDDERANVQNGVAVARLEADPGTYDVRVVSGDKARTPLGSTRRFFIPGFKREAGRWLFNGSPVVYAGQNPAPATSFVPNLRRDKKVKLPVVIPTNGTLRWDVLATSRPIADTQRLFMGVEGVAVAALSGTGGGGFVLPSVTSRGVNPVAATILFPLPEQPLRLLEDLALQADAIVVGGNSQTLLKIARRNAEEAPNFDLPIFAQFSAAPSAPDALHAFQSGASDIIVPEATTNPVLDILARQSARLSGAVTLEDVGVPAKDFERFAPILRSAGRVPLVARLPGEGNGAKKSDDKIAESMLMSFDATSDQATLDKIERAAKVGATIYCEGALPPALWPRWSEITKVQIASAPAKTQTLSLGDPWFWGTINDQNFDVQQTLSLTVKPSISTKIKDVKGEARETVARPIAHFNGDPNGIMLCPVGRGRIIWAPFDVSLPNTSALEHRVPPPNTITTPITITNRPRENYVNDSPFQPSLSEEAKPVQLTDYYAAVAGAMQPALVTYNATSGDTSGVSVALRGTRTDPDDPKSIAATLVAFFNSSNAPVDLNASIRGDGAYALDLETDRPLAATVRDYSTHLSLTVPANGFRWIAIAKDAQTWAGIGKGNVRARLK